MPRRVETRAEMLSTYQDNLWYHVTGKANLRSIRDHGLVPTERGMSKKNFPRHSVAENGIYLFPTIAAAEGYRQPKTALMEQTGWNQEDAVILQISNIDRSKLIPDPEEINGIINDSLRWVIGDGWSKENVKKILIENYIPEPIANIFANYAGALYSSNADASGQIFFEYILMEMSPQERELLIQWWTDYNSYSAVVYLGVIPAQNISIANYYETYNEDYGYPKDLYLSELSNEGFGLDDYEDEKANYYKYQPLLAKTAMADRSGIPEIDQLIEDFLKQPIQDRSDGTELVETLRDPASSHGMCDMVTAQFVNFARERGFKAYAERDYLDVWGYEITNEPQGEILDSESNIIPGHYDEHCVAAIYLEGTRRPIWIDFTASQYGYSDHPKVIF